MAPGAASVAIAQDRAAEKAHFGRCGVACAPYAEIHTAADVAKVADDLLPGILKTARMGYDGKGQLRVTTRDELNAGWPTLGSVPCVLEKMLPLASECSVIVARGRDGAMVNLPVQRNLHRDGILAVTEVFDGNVPAELAERAIAIIQRGGGATSGSTSICFEILLIVNFGPTSIRGSSTSIVSGRGLFLRAALSIL